MCIISFNFKTVLHMGSESHTEWMAHPSCHFSASYTSHLPNPRNLLVETSYANLIETNLRWFQWSHLPKFHLRYGKLEAKIWP